MGRTKLTGSRSNKCPREILEDVRSNVTDILLVKSDFFPTVCPFEIAEALKATQRVWYLDIHLNPANDVNLKSVFDVLAENRSVTRVFLRHVNSTSVRALGEAMRTNRSVTHLSFFVHPNGTRDDWAFFWDCLCVNSSVVCLSFRGVPQDGFASLGDVLKCNTSLKELHIAHGSEIAMTCICKGLKVNNTFESLYLNFVRFDAGGAEALADVLKVSRTLKHLEVADNSLSAEEGRGICEAMKVNRSLKTLILERNNADYAILADVLKRNDVLQHLHVDDECIEQQCIVMCESLKWNTTLLKLSIGDVFGKKFSPDFGDKIAICLEPNGSVFEVVKVPGKQISRICQRNKERHDKVRESVMVLIRIGRYRRAQCGIPRDVMMLLAVELWKMRSDIDFYQTKETMNNKKQKL